VISSVHRVHLLGNFDEVLVMQAGRLVAQGPADELALTCREFQRLTFSGATAENPLLERSSAAA
jgi:ABC-type multidrug transport system fused ATPase/permease subunit